MIFIGLVLCENVNVQKRVCYDDHCSNRKLRFTLTYQHSRSIIACSFSSYFVFVLVSSVSCFFAFSKITTKSLYKERCVSMRHRLRSEEKLSFLVLHVIACGHLDRLLQHLALVSTYHQWVEMFRYVVAQLIRTHLHWRRMPRAAPDKS